MIKEYILKKGYHIYRIYTLIICRLINIILIYFVYKTFLVILNVIKSIIISYPNISPGFLIAFSISLLFLLSAQINFEKTLN